jgi:hypothetical protein
MTLAHQYTQSLPDRFSYSHNGIRAVLGKWDEAACADYTGTDYHVIATVLRNALPKAKP